jgi:hypothetical protein
MRHWDDLRADRPRADWVSVAEYAIVGGLLDPSEVAACLADLWLSGGGVSDPQPLRERPVPAWLKLWGALGGQFALDGRLHEHRRPHAPLTLYRAARDGAQSGMSWSPFRETARDFAGRRPNAVIWAADVEPSDMLGGFGASLT